MAKAKGNANRNRAVAVSDDMKKWQTEEDLRCFERCAEVKKDPARLKAVQKLADEKLKSLAYVMGESREGQGG